MPIHEHGRENSSYLPIVNPDTGFSVQQEVLVDEDYAANQLERLSIENPAIANLITIMASQAEDFSGPEATAEAITTVGVLVYRLLESQAEADQLAPIE